MDFAGTGAHRNESRNQTAANSDSNVIEFPSRGFDQRIAA